MLNPPSTLYIKKNQITPHPFRTSKLLKPEMIKLLKSSANQQTKTIKYIFTPTTTMGPKIGSYLRDLRICSPQYLDQEFRYIENSVKSLTFFILNARKKKLSTCISQINKRKTFPLLVLLTDLSLNTGTNTKIISMEIQPN